MIFKGEVLAVSTFQWFEPLYTGGEFMSEREDGIEITFLGTGTSQGVPMIGCDCAVCQSGDPRDKRTRASIHVKTTEAAWVVDTGPDFRSQVLREGIRWLDAVVYTHSHTDHIMGFDDLRRFCDARNGTLPIFASPETMADLRRVFSFAFNGTAIFPGYVQPDAQEVTGPFFIGETELRPLRVKHGRAHVFGYLFLREGKKRAAYLSDCKEVSPEAAMEICGVPTLIIDGLRERPHPTHMSVGEAVAFAREIGAGETWITHLCHDLGHAATEEKLQGVARVGFDGLKIVV